MLITSKGRRLSRGKDSSSRIDQTNTARANNGGVRNTACHEPAERIAIPRNGAAMGVKRKIVKMSDITRAISSPTKRSRTPATVVMNTAEAPTPATKRAVSISSRFGATAAAIPPMMYNGKPIRSTGIRPMRSDKMPKGSCATWPIKKNTMICDVAVDSGARWKWERSSANTGSIISMPRAVNVMVQADKAIYSRDPILIYLKNTERAEIPWVVNAPYEGGSKATSHSKQMLHSFQNICTLT